MFYGPKGWKGLSWVLKYNSQCRLSSNSGSLEVNRPPQWVKHVVSIHVKALSNETSLEKYGYFHLLCICLSQHVLCDVRVFRCIIERHSSVIKYLTVIPFHFLFSWTNHKNFPISLCFVFFAPNFPIFVTTEVKSRKRPTPDFSMELADEPLRCQKRPQLIFYTKASKSCTFFLLCRVDKANRWKKFIVSLGSGRGVAWFGRMEAKTDWIEIFESRGELHFLGSHFKDVPAVRPWSFKIWKELTWWCASLSHKWRTKNVLGYG